MRNQSSVLGDFNSISSFKAPQRLTGLGLIDAFASTHDDADSHPTWTWPTRPLPLALRIDYIFHTPHFTTTKAEIIRRDGSDHSLLVAELHYGEPSGQTDHIESRLYTVLIEPPDSTLDKIVVMLSSSKSDPRQQLLEQFASSAIDGQRAVSMLELACYADLQCHSVEYPLRIATIDFVRENLDSPSVRNAVNWIRESYESRLPLDAPGDEAEHFKGALVQSMKIRMTEYANELLQPDDSAHESK